MVKIENLSLAYALGRGKSMAALAGVNACFEAGKFSLIIGPSGCGKTSMIRIMAGILKPSAGGVFINGETLGGVRKNTAVIFQDFGLLPWKTVRANAELPLVIAGRGRAGRQKAGELLARFGLESFHKRYPHELSGGMKQRLAIVRALAMEPELLLMDEPFSSLDAIMREEAQDFFLSVKNEWRLTAVMVTHSIEEAVYLADTVYVMSGRNPGTLGACFSIERDLPQARFRESGRFQEYCSILRGALRGRSALPEGAGAGGGG
jgi:NitT/TauT family transport system ATP-binding protein